jgi:uncharacterized integral membrane protein (TIGR00698 family)
MELRIEADKRTYNSKIPGLFLALLLALVATGLAHTELFKGLGVSPLTIGILLGIGTVNLIGRKFEPVIDEGVNIAKSKLLKLGVILFGLHFTYAEVLSLGWRGLTIDVLVIVSVLMLSLFVGRCVLKLDYTTSLLIGAGSAICGAAAILATAPVVKAKSETVVIAVATVVIFGTVSMFLYPAIWPYLQISAADFGVFTGATIHEVAQVVAVGTAIGPESAQNAVLEKMLRVILLAPFLLILALSQPATKNGQEKQRGQGVSLQHMPWFALFFLVVIGVNSLVSIPNPVVSTLMSLDTMLLTMAMVALGLKTHVSVITQAGYKPLLLGFVLFLFLVIGGGLLNYWL